MNIGISLASFYPEHPEDSIARAKALGFDTVELFVNTYSELQENYIEMLSALFEKHSLKVYSLHPFTSALENYMFFSPYDRRVADSVKLYEFYCNTAQKLGAKVINIHGDRGLGLSDLDKYSRCLEPLLELSTKTGITLAHENVFFNSVNHPEFVYKLREKLGFGALKFTFDIKQANKGGSDPVEVCQAMGTDIINFHINDYDDEHICMLPGEGVVNYKKIFDILKANHYVGPALIEVYSNNYTDINQIKRSAEFLRSIK